MITSQKLCVNLSQNKIIHDLDFAAEAGQLTAILGPNGSGKTTLLRALIGELPYAGSCQMNGDEISSLSAVQLASRRAVLAQFSQVSFPFTVSEVISIGITASGQGATENPVHELIAESLDLVGLPCFAGRFYAELSGGEQQRVHLARVLCQIWQPVSEGTPKWLFLDEPVASLDIQYQLKIMEIAKDFAERGGGVIAIMHDLNLSAMFADSVALLSKGHLLSQGTPKKVLTNSNLKSAFNCELRARQTPTANDFFVLPQSAKKVSKTGD